MPDWGSFSYAFGPLFALGGVGILAWLLRRSSEPADPARDPDDVRAPVIGPLPWREVNRIVVRLRAVGLDPTISSLSDGFRVMVPADDLAPARQAIWSDLHPGS
jgi:hypothetical protein